MFCEARAIVIDSLLTPGAYQSYKLKIYIPRGIIDINVLIGSINYDWSIVNITMK